MSQCETIVFNKSSGSTRSQSCLFHLCLHSQNQLVRSRTTISTSAIVGTYINNRARATAFTRRSTTQHNTTQELALAIMHTCLGCGVGLEYSLQDPVTAVLHVAACKQTVKSAGSLGISLAQYTDTEQFPVQQFTPTEGDMVTSEESTAQSDGEVYEYCVDNDPDMTAKMYAWMCPVCKHEPQYAMVLIKLTVRKCQSPCCLHQLRASRRAYQHPPQTRTYPSPHA